MKSPWRAIPLVALTAIVAIAAVPADTSDGDPAEVYGVAMVDYAFQPADLTVRPGDIIQFVQKGQMPHNVEFRKTPRGVNLGDATMGPFIVRKGDTYRITIDGRFEPGVYEFVCTPHEGMGMTARFTVLAGS